MLGVFLFTDTYLTSPFVTRWCDFDIADWRKGWEQGRTYVQEWGRIRERAQTQLEGEGNVFQLHFPSCKLGKVTVSLVLSD